MSLAVCRTAARLASTAVILCLLGCSPHISANASGISDSSYAFTSGTATQSITDPTFPGSVIAATVTYPAGWHYSGTLVQSSGCIPVPFPVYRAVSPDGLSFTEHMPAIGWVFGSGPLVARMTNGCFPLHSALSAQDFLKRLSVILNVQYIADDPIPADVLTHAQQKLQETRAQYAARYAAAGLQQPTTTRTLARAIVHYVNGSFPMRGRITAMVDCTTTNIPGQKSYLRGIADTPGSSINRCTADIQYFAAPENQYDAVLRRADIPDGGITPNMDWVNRWINRNQAQTNAAIGGIIHDTIIANDNTRAHYQQAIAAQTRIHNQFMAQMQASTDASMARTTQAANARHTIASDWTDYVLDQQTVRDPQTGMTTKVASGYNVTWMNSLGGSNYQVFQTNDVNSNPNGVITGTWVQQVRTHGDGTF